MNAVVHSKTFKSGNGVAVRLPKAFGIPEGAEVELKVQGDTVVIQPIEDAAAAKARLARFVERMRALPAPGELGERLPIEFPDRPGLY